MSQKNETAVLLLSLLITVALVAAGFWWFTKRNGTDLGQSPGNPSNPTTTTPGEPTPSNQSSTVESFAKVQNVPSGLFSYGGSTTWAPIRREVDGAIQKEWTQFQLRYTQPTSDAPGSGTGIKMLLNNQLAFSQSSRSIKNEEYQQASQRGFTLKEIPVAIDGIAVAVNPTLNIKGLTIAQLKDIYTGKLTNWNQVSGPNLPITAYSRRKEDGGTIEFFLENILGGGDFGTNIKFIPTTTQALRELANNPGGIYYASAPEVVPQCGIKSVPVGRKADEFIPPYKEPFVPIAQCPGKRNQLNAEAFKSGQYPITRRLFVIVKQNGQDDQRAGVAYSNLLLTTQGQQLINRAGFVSIR